MGKLTKGLFSSNTDLWATPQDFFDKLNEEFHFTLDPCALPENAKCAKYFTPAEDGLKQNWGGGAGCFAIHHTAEPSRNGSGNATRKAGRQAPSLSCSYLHEPTRHIFTTTSITMQTCASYADGCISTRQNKAHHSRQWW